MILQDVIAESAAEILTLVDVEPIMITGISDNSKDVKEGYLFVALSGYSVDGHGYIKDAVRLGAAAVIGEQDIMNLKIPYIIDYAHTADAFFHTLQTVKECGAKRILHIFGFR